MSRIKVLIIILSTVVASQCSASNNSQLSSNLDQNSSSPIDYKSLILGKWEGRASYVSGDGHLVMFVTFNEGNLTVDYSPSGGGKFIAPYKFKDERTIESSRYPENLVIVRYGDKVIGFRPEGDKLREDIEMIYECRFEKPVQ
jgi:hypothetical protein